MTNIINIKDQAKKGYRQKAANELAFLASYLPKEAKEKELLKLLTKIITEKEGV